MTGTAAGQLGSWAEGAAAGLLPVAASQAVIDNGAERRATPHLHRLMALDQR